MSARSDQQPDFLFPMYLKKPGREHAPRPRNREIFEAVRVQGMSEREAAVKFSLSKTRVHQICEAVTNWVARTGGGPARTWSERQRLSEYLHRERLEDLYRHSREAWKNSEQVRTTRVYMEAGKPDRKVLAAKVSPGETRYLALALKTENARSEFEDDRPKPQEPDAMTMAERVRELEEMVKEALRFKEQLAKQAEEEATQEPPPVEQVDDLPAAEDDEQPLDEPSLPMTDSPQMTNDSAPPVAAAGRLPTCPTAARPVYCRKDPLAGVDLSLYAPLPPPEPYVANRQYPNTPDGLPPPMILIEKPTADELDQYFILEDGLPTWRPPTILGKRSPCGYFWQRYQPLPPNSAVQRKKKA